VLAVETGDLLVVRFSPMHVDALMEDAEDSAKECESLGEPRLYSVSTFGLIKTEDDTEDELLRRICEEAPVGGRRVWLASGRALGQEGFVTRLRAASASLRCHSGEDLHLPDVEKLVKCLTPGRERNPAWRK